MFYVKIVDLSTTVTYQIPFAVCRSDVWFLISEGGPKSGKGPRGESNPSEPAGNGDTSFYGYTYSLTLALVGGRGGSNGPPWFFANNSRKARRIAAKLAVPPHVNQLDTYCENFKSMSCQVIKL